MKTDVRTIVCVLLFAVFLSSSSYLSAQQDIPVVVNRISNAKTMLLLDDSNSMQTVIEHPDFVSTDATVLDATKTIPDIIFKLNSGAAAAATSQTMVPAIFSINWYGFSVSGSSRSIFGGRVMTDPGNIPVVLASSCNNTSGTTVNCPGSSSTPRTGTNSLKLYSNASIVGNSIFTLANLAKVSGVNVTDSSGNEFLYANYRLNDYATKTVGWSTYWPKINSSGDLITYTTTVYSTSGSTVVFNGKEIFLSAGLYRIEYLRWLFYIATADQLANLPGVTRMQAVKDATEALVLANPTVQFGIATLNGTNYTPGVWNTGTLGDQSVCTDGYATIGGRPRIRAAIGSSTATLLTQISQIVGAGSTPLTTTYIETLRYFNGERDNDPYCNNCQYTSPITSACDGNFVVALTDGIPVAETQNQVQGVYISDFDGDGEEDAANNRNCSDPVCAQFLDDASYYAFHNDFQTSLPGTQVIRTYAVGFGLSYDLLNSFAVNGGSGESLRVDTATQVTDALQAIVSNLITTAVGAAGVATAEVFGENGQVFRPRFEALNWTGAIDKYISVDGELIELFDIGEVLEDRDITANPRNIIVGYDTDGDGLTTTSMAFSTANATQLRPELFRLFINGSLSSSLLATPIQNFAQTSSATALINYLHGTDADGMRARDGNGNSKVDRLGDIVYSRPAYVSSRMGNYRSMTGYNTFIRGRQTEPKLLLVGANDGMLHAFDADTGEELWAYIPSSVVRYLELLSRTTYNTQYHKYFVNGQIGVEDVFIGGQWRTYAMFGLGGGGSTWTVLDITDRDSPTLVWEVSHPASGGESWNEPVVAVVNGGSSTDPNAFDWYMLVGTGEDKATAGANVLVYNLESATAPAPTVLSISASAPAGTRTTGVTVSQNDRDFNVDRGYVGTEEGDMYRIRMDGAPNTWTVAKLFDGATTQPIVAKPVVVLAENPQFTNAVSGVASEPLAISVMFGTGRYDEISDVTAVGTVAQNIIGVFDPVKITTDTYSNMLTNVVKANLKNQSVGTYGVTRDATGVYRLSTQQAGFYMNLDTSIQIATGNFIRPVGMVTYPPLNVRGTVIFSTFLPAQEQCAVGGYGFVQSVNYITGGGSVVDLFKDETNPFYNGGIPELTGDGIVRTADLTEAYNLGKIQTVFDAHVESIDLTSERPYKHDNELNLDDIWMHSTNGGVMPSVASLGERGLPGPPAILFQDGQIVIQSAYTDSGDGDDGAGGDEDETMVTICVIVNNSDPDSPDRDTLSVPESDLNDYLAQGATIGPCAEDVDDKKKTICHLPPGNPENLHTITVSENAWPAHQAHGDYEGPCVAEDDDDDDEGDPDDGEEGTEDPDTLPINLYSQPAEILSEREVPHE